MFMFTEYSNVKSVGVWKGLTGWSAESLIITVSLLDRLFLKQKKCRRNVGGIDQTSKHLG